MTHRDIHVNSSSRHTPDRWRKLEMCTLAGLWQTHPLPGPFNWKDPETVTLQQLLHPELGIRCHFSIKGTKGLPGGMAPSLRQEIYKVSSQYFLMIKSKKGVKRQRDGNISIIPTTQSKELSPAKAGTISTTKYRVQYWITAQSIININGSILI